MAFSFCFNLLSIAWKYRSGDILSAIPAIFSVKRDFLVAFWSHVGYHSQCE